MAHLDNNERIVGTGGKTEQRCFEDMVQSLSDYMRASNNSANFALKEYKVMQDKMFKALGELVVEMKDLRLSLNDLVDKYYALRELVQPYGENILSNSNPFEGEDENDIADVNDDGGEYATQ